MISRWFGMLLARRQSNQRWKNPNLFWTGKMRFPATKRLVSKFSILAFWFACPMIGLPPVWNGQVPCQLFLNPRIFSTTKRTNVLIRMARGAMLGQWNRDQFNNHWKKSLLMTLIRVFGKEFIIASGIKLIVDCLQFVEPLLVEKLIMFVRDQTQEIEVGFIISIMFFINALCKGQIRN